MRTIQLLNWNLRSIERILPDIKAQGFDSIQINPMQPFKEENEFHWYLSYQPLGFRIGNMFGTKEDLISLCKKANEMGISIIVDVICNHMANQSDKKCLYPHESVDQELLSRPDFWKKPEMLINGDCRPDAVTKLIGLPGLDLKNKDLQKIIFRYLNELKECGVRGFRFDAAKHIGLPNDGVDFFDKVRKFLIANGMTGYGEFLGGDRPWRDEFSDIIPLLSGFKCDVADKRKFMTFFESHDTFLNDDGHQTRYISTRHVIDIYSLLTMSYGNTLFYARPKLFPFNPYSKVTNNWISLLNDPINAFETDFLENKNIREANEDVKVLRLTNDIRKRQ